MIDLQDIMVDEIKNADTRQTLQNADELWPACAPGTVMVGQPHLLVGVFLTAVSRGPILDILRPSRILSVSRLQAAVDASCCMP